MDSASLDGVDIGVVGAGTMGAGIALVAAVNGAAAGAGLALEIMGFGHDDAREGSAAMREPRAPRFRAD